MNIVYRDVFNKKLQKSIKIKFSGFLKYFSGTIKKLRQEVDSS